MESRLSMNRGISVVICCYNSAWVIRRTLEALIKQQFKVPVPYEIVLVDNRCTDSTVEVAEDTMKGSEIDFHIVREDNPGLANARRKGINEAKYEYVLYCDDDNLLCPNYVSSVVELLDNMPEVGAVGGKGIAEFEAEPADIVKKNLECYAVGSQLEHKDWLFGAGIALRTNLVRDIYNNQHCFLMGRTEQKLLSGDDTELVLSIQLRGYKIYASDDFFFTHVLKASRLSESYFNKMFEGLLIPQPVFAVMRAAIHDIKFFDAIHEYLQSFYRYHKYHILWWKKYPRDKYDRASINTRIFRYWGLIRLFIIYRHWLKIKNQRHRA